jgi:hypothetical protein
VLHGDAHGDANKAHRRVRGAEPTYIGRTIQLRLVGVGGGGGVGGRGGRGGVRLLVESRFLYVCASDDGDENEGYMCVCEGDKRC